MSDRLWGEMLDGLKHEAEAMATWAGYVKVDVATLQRLLRIADYARDACDAYFRPERFGEDCDFNEDMKSLREECQDYEER